MVQWPPELEPFRTAPADGIGVFQWHGRWPVMVFHQTGPYCHRVYYYDQRTMDMVLAAYYPFYQDVPYSVEEEAIMNRDALKKATANAKGKGSDQILKDPRIEKEFPNLAAFLLLVEGPDGPREVCKVQTFASDDGWKAALVDYEGRQTLYATIERPEDAWEALEKALTKPKLDWRSWDGRKGRGGAAKGRGG